MSRWMGMFEQEVLKVTKGRERQRSIITNVLVGYDTQRDKSGDLECLNEDIYRNDFTSGNSASFISNLSLAMQSSMK